MVEKAIEFSKHYNTKLGEITIDLGKSGVGWAFRIRKVNPPELVGNGHYSLSGNQIKIEWMNIFRGYAHAFLPRRVANTILEYHKTKFVTGFGARKGKLLIIKPRIRK